MQQDFWVYSCEEARVWPPPQWCSHFAKAEQQEIKGNAETLEDPGPEEGEEGWRGGRRPPRVQALAGQARPGLHSEGPGCEQGQQLAGQNPGLAEPSSFPRAEREGGGENKTSTYRPCTAFALCALWQSAPERQALPAAPWKTTRQDMAGPHESLLTKQDFLKAANFSVTKSWLATFTQKLLLSRN